MFRDRVKPDPLTEMSSELNRLTDSLNKANETASGLGAIEERISKLKTEYRTLNAIAEEQLRLSLKSSTAYFLVWQAATSR